MSARTLWCAIILSALACLGRAQEARPSVGIGATKEEVINAYGWPSGQSHAGSREILTYPQGLVTLVNGRVEKVDFSLNVPWPAPKPRPGTPTPTTVKKVEAPVNFWLGNFDEASREALRRRARILVLFVGSDWSPPSKKFSTEVEFHPEFVNAFTGSLVFLRLDYPNRVPQTAEQRTHNAALRERYQVTEYPTLLIVSPSGNLVGRVDLAKARPGDTYRAKVIAAVQEVVDYLVANPPPPEPNEGGAVDAAVAAGSIGRELSEGHKTRVDASLERATGAVTYGLVGGSALMVVMFWLLWRKRGGGNATAVTVNNAAAARIAEAASGLPSLAELQECSRGRLRGLIAGMVEAEGYRVTARPEGSDIDLELRRGGELEPRVLVVCMQTGSGVMPTKRVRELFASMTAEGVANGWAVSPGGFPNDARAYAKEHGIMLLDGAWMLTQLKDLPPVVVPQVIARVA